MIVGVFVLIAVNIIVLSISSNRYPSYYGSGRIAISIIAPFQKVTNRSIRFVRDVWRHYFFLVTVAKENDKLKKVQSQTIEKNNHYNELKLSNLRLRSLLNFHSTMTNRVSAAEVIGKDPSPWFKTIIIDKGKDDGVGKGMAVVIPEGIAGQVMDVSSHYSKVLLIIDPNSAVDVMVQRTRARGIIKGGSEGLCHIKYVLRKQDVSVGDRVISSGLDGVFPKGLAVGHVSSVIRRNSGIFQEVTVTPHVDFEKLEEVLVVLNYTKHEFVSEQ